MGHAHCFVCVYGGGGGERGVWWDGKWGRKDITESYGGDQVNLSWKNQNTPTPTPSPR